MSSVQKFTFDLDFGAPETPSEPEAVDETEADLEPEIEVPTFSEEELEQARAEGFDAGREEGRSDAAAATEQRLVEGIDGIAQQLSDLLDAQAAENTEIGREMTAVAVGIAKKVFPDLNARNALGEIERIIQETLSAITEEPRVQVFVAPDLREPMNERLAVLTSRAAYDGKVFVNADPTLELGDCRVEWSNGSAIRDTEALWEMIDEIVERNLHGDPAPVPSGEDAASDGPPRDEAAHEDEPAAAETAPETTDDPAAHESVTAEQVDPPAPPSPDPVETPIADEHAMEAAPPGGRPARRRRNPLRTACRPGPGARRTWKYGYESRGCVR